jgi:hypothetical protein
MNNHLCPTLALVPGQMLPDPTFPTLIPAAPPCCGPLYRWWVSSYEPPLTPTDVTLWSDVHLFSVIAAPVVARAILRDGRRNGHLYRAGPYVVALRRSLVPELNVPLARGEWIRLDSGLCGRNLLELYAYENIKSYRDAVVAIGMMAGVIAADGAVRPLRSQRRWGPELHPLHWDDPAYHPNLPYPPNKLGLSYRNAAGHPVAEVIRITSWPALPLDFYRSLWRHSLSKDTQWIETFPRPPYPLFNADQVFGRREENIFFVENEFVAHELGLRFADYIFSAVPGGLKNLGDADLTSLRARRVGIIFRREDILYGRRIEAALRLAGVADAFFVLRASNTQRSFADLDAVAAAEGIDLLPLLDDHAAGPGNVIVWEAGEPMPDAAVERPLIIKPIVRAGDLVWIYGAPKSGKTWLALVLANLASIGKGAVGPWTAVEPSGVLYVDGEMHAVDLGENIAKVMNGAGHVPCSDHARFGILSAKVQPDGIIDLADPDWQKQIGTHLAGRTLLILDNFQSLTDNGPAALKEIYPWLRRLCRAGIAIIIMDHTNREGELQGSIMKERIADLSIALRYVSAEDREAGIVTIEFPVARRLYGDDVHPFRIQRIFIRDSFSLRLLDLEVPSSPELSPEEEAWLDRIAIVVIAREQGLTFKAIEAQHGIAASSAHGLARGALTLTGAARIRFEAECDRLRREPERQS